MALPSLHDYDVKMPNFTYCGGREHTTTTLFFFAWTSLPSYKHERGWENSRQLCKPETKSRVCITVENSPNASSAYIRLCKHRKRVFYCFYKITFPRKNAKLFVRHWLKENSYQSQSLVHEVLHAQSVLVLQKGAFQNTYFSSLKFQLKRRKTDTPSL